VTESWAWRPLGELFELGAGKTMSAAARAGPDKIPFLRTSNVFWDRIDLSNLDAMSLLPRDLPGRLLEPGDLLVCEGGEIGRAAIWDGQIETVTFQNHLHRLRPKVADVVPRFYVFFLESAFTQLGIFEGAGNETTIPNLSASRLAALEVPHPPVNVQRSITTVLSAVRRALETQGSLAELAQELRSALMERLLTDGLGGMPKRDSEIGPVPEAWTVGRVIEFAEFQRGFDITKKEQVRSGNVPVVSSGGIKSHHDVAAVEGPGVVVGRKGSIGSLHFVDSDFWPHDTTLWCRDFRGNVPKFVYYRLHQVDMKKLDSGATNPALNRNFLHDELISWPSVEEQALIVAIIESIEDKIGLHHAKSELFNELYLSMLHGLMTGAIAAGAVDLSALSDPDLAMAGVA